jgi:hypothetical protein
MTPIDKVSQKDVGRLWRPSTDHEQLHEIKELTMQITHNGDWTCHWLDVAFFHEKF